MLLLIDEDYKDDTVIIRVDGKQVYHKEGVTTKLTISLADEVKWAVDQDKATISVEVPTRDAKGQEIIEIDEKLICITISRKDRMVFIEKQPCERVAYF